MPAITSVRLPVFVRMEQLLPVVEMQHVECSTGCGGKLWVGPGDSGPYFCTMSCQELYMDAQANNNESSERATVKEPGCIVSSSSPSVLSEASPLLLTDGSATES